MARQSNPGKDYLSSGLNGYIPNVWPDNPDLFDHVQLAANWDAIDANLGRLDKERPILGEIKPWYQIDPSADLTAIFPNDGTKGWVICDGRTIATGAHDFPHLGTDQRNSNGVGVDSSNILHTPDLRNRGLLGADTSKALCTAGTETAGPGIGGLQGSQVKAVVPDHSHDFSHIHKIGAAGTPHTNQAGQDNSGDPYFVSADASGSGFNLTRTTHAHILLDQYTSVPRDPANPLKRQTDVAGSDGSTLSRSMTSLQKKVDQPLANGQAGAGNTGSAQQTPAGGTAGDALSIDARDASVGVLWVMYVKRAT